MKRLAKAGFGIALAVAIPLALAAPALAIAPALQVSISAQGNSAAAGWYNVPVTLVFHNIVWDDPIMGGTYDISSITCSKGGATGLSVVPTSSLDLCQEGVYSISAQGTWGGSAYPMTVRLDWTSPASAPDGVSASKGQARISIRAADALSGPMAVCYALDNAPDATISVSPSNPVAVISAGQGTHRLAWTAVDAAGNRECSWHRADFTVLKSSGAVLLNRPKVRAKGRSIALAGSLTGLEGSSRVTVVVERRVGSRWRRVASYSLTSNPGATAWSASRHFAKTGRYRVHLVGTAGAKSGFTTFRV